MQARDRIMAYRGQLLLGLLWSIKPLAASAGLRSVYLAWLARLVKTTGLFDRAYYLEHHGDVAQSHMRPLRHYVAHGDREGRAPMAFFDPVYYRAHAPGRTKRVNALLHYAYVGRYLRISPSPWFDLDYYLRENKDVARARTDPLLHYVNWGGLEGRSPNAQFDGAFYLRSNPDVLQVRMNPLLHYLVWGRAEGRATRPNPDAEQPGETGEIAPALMPDPGSWSQLQPRAIIPHAKVDVIVPVYKGKVETLACLFSVLAAASDTPYELVVINDASPDPDLASELERLAGLGLFTLITNPQNRGFVATVNLGMRLHAERDVVLLNADTEVYDRWLDRLLSTAYRHQRTGTVTPLSNNATICSYPRFLHDNPYPLELSYAELDALTAQVNAGVAVEAPTGVGFCLYIKRACLAEVGSFDQQAFGKGYGEENDFCQRAMRRDWHNLIAADVFVRHWGSTSFQGETTARIKAAMKQMDGRHPRYQAEVKEFILRDPLAEARHRLDWARLTRLRRPRNVLIVNHNRGGGTERHIQEDTERLNSDGVGVFLMRPAREDHTRIYLGSPMFRFAPNLLSIPLSAVETLADRLQELGVSEIHTHSLVDFQPDAPVKVRDLARSLGARWEVNLHDYKVICPRINLIDENGLYCGEPAESACNRCLATRGSEFGVTDIRLWRNMHEQALDAADRILVPDPDVAIRLKRYFPRIACTVSPHEDIDRVRRDLKRATPEGVAPLHIVVVGAIGKLKGYNVLLACARDAKVRRLPLRFSVLGYTMDDRPLAELGVQVTGKYREEDALQKLQQLRPDLIWLPSIWPETYSYTLSIALRTDCPIAAFDIGAIAARLGRIGETDYLMPLTLAGQPRVVNQRLMTANVAADVGGQFVAG